MVVIENKVWEGYFVAIQKTYEGQGFWRKPSRAEKRVTTDHTRRLFQNADGEVVILFTANDEKTHEDDQSIR